MTYIPYLENWVMRSRYSRIGAYIRLVDKRNTGLKVKQLLGLSISKEFIPSVANTIGTDMEKYKIIRKHQFACSTMQVRRDKKMPVALLKDVDEAIISQAYPVFEVIDDNKLLPEYLMMWFSRHEFDREACFYAIGGVRGSLEWEDFCDMKLPVPHIDKQKEIVKEYNTIVNRINLNNQLIQKLEETAQAIYKRWFVEFEFPNEEGKPYKSSGGEMVESELGEIPRLWKVVQFTKVINLGGGGTPSTSEPDYWNGEIPFFTPIDITGNFYTVRTEKNITNNGLKSCNSKLYPKNTVFVTARGTVGAVAMAGCKMAMNQSCYAIQDTKRHSKYFLHLLTLETIKHLKSVANGAVFSALVTRDFDGQYVVEPLDDLISKFDLFIKGIYHLILNIENQNLCLYSLKELILSKLATIKK